MNTQAKVAVEKQNHPERFCKVPRCLWRVTELVNGATGERIPRQDCPGGYCPRHARKKQQYEFVPQPYLGHGPRYNVRKEKE